MPTAPRPVIYSKPAVQAKVGAEYRGQVSANRSLGDLREAWPEGRQLLGHRETQVCLEGTELAQAGRGRGHALGHARRAREVRGGGHGHH